MNQEIKQRWLVALRSNEYEQGKYQLKTIKRDKCQYCCLGVLCDIINPNIWEEMKKEQVNLFATLPDNITNITNVSVVFQDRLSQMNDGLQMNFNEIADYIEEYL